MFETWHRRLHSKFAYTTASTLACDYIINTCSTTLFVTPQMPSIIFSAFVVWHVELRHFKGWHRQLRILRHRSSGAIKALFETLWRLYDGSIKALLILRHLRGDIDDFEFYVTDLEDLRRIVLGLQKRNRRVQILLESKARQYLYFCTGKASKLRTSSCGNAEIHRSAAPLSMKFVVLMRSSTDFCPTAEYLSAIACAVLRTLLTIWQSSYVCVCVCVCVCVWCVCECMCIDWDTPGRRWYSWGRARSLLLS
jgi:hypothetical protein